MLRAAIAAGGESAAEARRILEQLDRRIVRLPLPALYLLAAAVTLPLAARRRAPELVSAVVIAACAAALWYSPLDVSVPSIAAWLALYSLRSYGRPGRRGTVLAGVLLVVILLMTSGIVHHPEAQEPTSCVTSPSASPSR